MSLEFSPRLPNEPALPLATDLSRFFHDIWRDMASAGEPLWHAWLSIFPNDNVWNPYGAAASLVFTVLMAIWLWQRRMD